ncbi:MAG: LysR substrate-binding domain-containing protein [Aliishimia sp.]
MEKFPNFAGLKAFYALGLDQSLAEAGRRLGISASAVSHQIKNLEADLGQRLVEHKRGRLFLTAEGQSFFDQLRHPMSQISAAVSGIRSTKGRTRVTITLTPTFASSWFMPRMKRLTETYPELELNLVTTTRVIDLERENIDFAIRRGRDEWVGLESHILLNEHIVPVASRETMTAIAGRDTPRDLNGTQILVNTTLPNEWADWCKRHKIDLPDNVQRFNLETYELTINAARDGLGIALGRRPMIDDLIAKGELHLPFDDALSDVVSHRLVWSANRALSAPAKKVRNWLQNEVS